MQKYNWPKFSDFENQKILIKTLSLQTLYYQKQSIPNWDTSSPWATF